MGRKNRAKKERRLVEQVSRPKRRLYWIAGAVGLSALSSLAVVKIRPYFHAAVPTTVEEMLDWPDSDLDFGLAALIMTKKYFPETDVKAGMAELERYSARARGLLQGRSDRTDPLARIGAINNVLYLEEHYEYDHTDEMVRNPENRMLGNLLRRHKGSCANMFQLYYAVAERLGFPIDVAEAPQHAYLRYELGGGQHVNIEATSTGTTSSDEALITVLEIPPAAIKSGWMMRPLSKREAITMLLEDEVDALLATDRWGDAEQLLQRLIRFRPTSGANWWNLAVAQARGARRLRQRAEFSPQDSSLADEAYILTQLAKEHAARARDLGIPAPIEADYVDRERTIALWRKMNGREKGRPQNEGAWDPLVAIDQAAHADNSRRDDDDANMPSVKAALAETARIEAVNRRNAELDPHVPATYRPSSEDVLTPDQREMLQTAAFIERLNSAPAGAQADLLRQFSGLSAPVAPIPRPTHSLPLQEVH